ncbi:hypothetical protein BCR36DRAFT_408006 [Piromyces finnis]|uniref:CHHC U11-48K-type domain-containing protein n=1 Tax=Piromyces finnis TaxID=1754191 RepID=A0A1Y1VPE4_9FUNG|nr:hypothetical protein BCR36DRAFT_408006 [Piromyces finnis]|eukprot:ORX61022.1 hypothetical protein BCR36DRAFT_408006 [Piromyces finnis]
MLSNFVSSEDNINNNKRNEISKLNNQIHDLEIEFENVLNKYDLNINLLLNKQSKIDDRIVCPFNKKHIVSRKNYEKHRRRCELISKGINTKLSLPNPPSSQFFYSNTNTISLLTRNINDDDNNDNKDKNDKNIEFRKEYESSDIIPSYVIKKYENDKHIICNINNPLKSKNEVQEQTVQERLNEYINDLSLSRKIESEFIDKNKNVSNFEEIMDIVEERKAQMEKSEKSKAQLYAEQRDYKRRRKSYRAKNIKITKRSATQIQKDIIESFSKDYNLYLQVQSELQAKKQKIRKNKH